MKIYQGVDIVQVTKFREVFLRNEDFVTDIFTEREYDYCSAKKDPCIHYAGRFAAKEAGLKALGIGMSGMGIDNTFKEIEVIPGSSGKPVLGLSGWVDKIRKKMGISQLTVSISHSADYAVATVILSGQDTGDIN